MKAALFLSLFALIVALAAPARAGCDPGIADADLTIAAPMSEQEIRVLIAETRAKQTAETAEVQK